MIQVLPIVFRACDKLTLMQEKGRLRKSRSLYHIPFRCDSPQYAVQSWFEMLEKRKSLERRPKQDG